MSHARTKKVKTSFQHADIVDQGPHFLAGDETFISFGAVGLGLIEVGVGQIEREKIEWEYGLR